MEHLGLGTKPGLLDSDRLVEVLDDALDGKSFDDVTHELHIVATDMMSGTERYFREGSLARAVMASCAFPGVVSPVIVDSRVYSDGGIINNLPVEPLILRCRTVIGAQVNPVEPNATEQLATTVAVSRRAFQIATSQGIGAKLSRCTFRLAPEALLEIGIFDFDRVNERVRHWLSRNRRHARRDCG